MTVDAFIAEVEDRSPPAPAGELAAFEALIGERLPDDYREFLINCNGGSVGGRFWFEGPTPDGGSGGPGPSHIYGLRTEPHYSLLVGGHPQLRDLIPASLLCIMDDPFGNQICLGISGEHRGWIYAWDHEAGATTPIADSFTAFVAGLRELRRTGHTMFSWTRFLSMTGRPFRRVTARVRGFFEDPKRTVRDATVEVIAIHWLLKASRDGQRRLRVDCAIHLPERHEEVNPMWKPELLRLFAADPLPIADVPEELRTGSIDFDEPLFPQATIDWVGELRADGTPGDRVWRCAGSARLRIIFNCPDDLGTRAQLSYMTEDVVLALFDLPQPPPTRTA